MEKQPKQLNKILLSGAAIAACASIPFLYDYGVKNHLIPQPAPKTEPIPTDLAEKLQEYTLVPTNTYEPTITLTPEIIVSPTAEIDFLFGKIDLFNFDKQIRALLTTKSGNEFLIPSFSPKEYLIPADQTETFAPGNSVGLTWRNYYRFEGKNYLIYNLWLHSGELDGKDLEMTGIQKYLDFNPENGFRRNYKKTDEILLNEFIGSNILFDQVGNGSTLGEIVAAVRIPPIQVDEFFNIDPSQILEYLNKKYPNHGFENTLGKNEVIILTTCGTNLDGEPVDPKRKHYEQARYIFVLIAK